MNLSDKVKQLPDTPGVYLMKDALGNIIYVGKSIHLKRRVQSYFQQSKDHPQKVILMVRQIRDLEYMETDTEFEAFMLECRLIKELKPAYNKKMKSPQAYAYIEVVTDKHAFRRLNVTMLPDMEDNPLVFGPYSKRHALEKAVSGWKSCYKLDCSNASSFRTGRCLNYSMGLCLGMCMGGSALEEYNRVLDRFIALLQGADSGLLEDMNRRMAEAAEQFDFEAAARFRDAIGSVEFLLHKKAVIGLTEQNLNIAIVEWLTDCSLKLILVKRNKILYSEMFDDADKSPERLTARLQSRIIAYFAADSGLIPGKVTKHEVDEAQILYSYLQSNHCRYVVILDNWLEADSNGADELNEAIRQVLTADRRVRTADDEAAAAGSEPGTVT